jgi:hypothetical protein
MTRFAGALRATSLAKASAPPCGLALMNNPCKMCTARQGTIGLIAEKMDSDTNDRPEGPPLRLTDT